MNIIEYVKQNWDTLPKSTFDGDSLVVVKTIHDQDYGYGHHKYEGVAINHDGSVFWCYSSGCSCNGSCGADHKPTTKVFGVGSDSFNIDELDHKDVDFIRNQVDFKSY